VRGATDHGVDLERGIRSSAWRYVMAPQQDCPIALKAILPDKGGGKLLNTLAIRDEGWHGIIVISAKVIP